LDTTILKKPGEIPFHHAQNMRACVQLTQELQKRLWRYVSLPIGKHGIQNGAPSFTVCTRWGVLNSLNARPDQTGPDQARLELGFNPRQPTRFAIPDLT